MRVAGLFGRLRCLPSQTGLVTTAFAVFQYARRSPDSWASWAALNLDARGVPTDPQWGLGPGQPRGVVQSWLHQAVAHALRTFFVNRFRDMAAASESLATYLQVQPAPCLHDRVYNRRVAAADAREWGLTRCGHHPFSDGRSFRHLSDGALLCSLCFNEVGDLRHILLSCTGVNDLRLTWSRRLASSSYLHVARADYMLLFRWIFDPSHAYNNAASTAAHVSFVAACCRRFRCSLSGASVPVEC